MGTLIADAEQHVPHAGRRRFGRAAGIRQGPSRRRIAQLDTGRQGIRQGGGVHPRRPHHDADIAALAAPVRQIDERPHCGVEQERGGWRRVR